MDTFYEFPQNISASASRRAVVESNRSMMKKRAIFLDRDGVINRKMPEGDYVKDWSEFIFLPGVFEAFQILKRKDILTIVITNQSCVGKGIISEETLQDMHHAMQEEIRKHDGALDAIYFCPHEIWQQCACRKPKPGLILRALEDFRDKNIAIDREESFFIGDSESDMLAGEAAGLPTLRIGGSSDRQDAPVRTLLEAVMKIV